MVEVSAARRHVEMFVAVIHAMRYEPGRAGNCLVVHEWLGLKHSDDNCSEDALLVILTLEGGVEARPGDWIIRGVTGEFYPVKDSIFRETYERVIEL